MRLPRIGLMLGDATGVGPEIAVKGSSSGLTARPVARRR